MPKSMKIFASLIFALFISAQPVLAADPKIAPEALKSILMISSKRSPFCASGLLLDDGTILTSAHFIASVCPERECADLKLSYAESLNSAAQSELAYSSPAEIKFISYFLDAALLEFKDGTKNPGVFKLEENTNTSEDALALGFPSCKSLVLTQGKIEKQNSLKLYTSAGGQHGSSGAAILSADLRLIGIATQSDSFWEAVKSMLFNSYFPLRGLRADVLLGALRSNDRNSLFLSWSEEFYRKEVMPLQGSARIWPGIEYMDLVSNLKFDLMQAQPDLQVLSNLLLLEQYPSALVALSKSPKNSFEQSLERVELGFMLENKGAHSRLFTPLYLDGFMQAISATGRPAEHLAKIKEMLSAAQTSKHPGMELYFFTRYSLIAFIIVLCFLLWAFSLGFVFHAQEGSFLKRLRVMLCVAFLLWPVSLLWFFVFRLKVSKGKVG